MRDSAHCKMNPEAIDLVDEYYDYSKQNLEFLQNQFDKVKIMTKTEIENKKENKIEEIKEIKEIEEPNEAIEEENEEEWEDYDSEEEKDEKDEKELEEVPEQEEQYVLIKGYWHPLKDKLITKKFIKENLEINEKDEVLLKDGKILGHRKYAKYYRQNMVEIVKKKSEIIRALAYREMERANKNSNGTITKYESIIKTLER